MIVLIVGGFCVGKDTFADFLLDEIDKTGDYDAKKILSYTTREPREGESDTHEFCTKEDFFEFDDLVAQTKIGDNYYGARECQFDAEDFNIYVVDSKGASDVLAYGMDSVYIVEIIRPQWLINCPKARQNRVRHYNGDYHIDCRVINDGDINKLYREAKDCVSRLMTDWNSEDD